jgi:hypothetical protein
MTFHACGTDGTNLGEFSESEFRQKVASGELRMENYYWHEGMPDWRPIADYRLIADTQRISFHPPLRRTVKIDMDAQAQNSGEASAKSAGPMSRLRDRIRPRKWFSSAQ